MKAIIQLIISACFFLSASAYAEIVTDGTTGTISAHTLAPTVAGGQTFEIPQSLGTPAGGNLFHSFSAFNINTGESVTFTSVDSFQNVISRVTGTTPSVIDGLLKSTIGNANFYFINPNGVTFNAHAVVEVPAAFYVSTANQINFPNGAFSASSPGSDVSTFTANPVSFGFVGTNSTGTIGFDGSQITLNQNPPQSLDVVASNIAVQNNAKLVVPAGEVRLVAMKGSNEVSLARDGNGFLPLPAQTPTVENAGNILVDNSVISTDGNSGGRAGLWANDAVFNKSQFSTNNNGDLDASTGKGIEINTYNLISNGIYGIYGDLATSGWISSDSRPGSSGKAGDVNVTSQTLYISNVGQISADTYSNKDASNVNIKAKTMTIEGVPLFFTGISCGAFDSIGNAGNTTIDADNLNIISTGSIQSLAIANGKGGNIIVSARNLTIDGNNNFYTTGIETFTYSSANAGTVFVKADHIELLNAGTILGDSYFSSGNAGNLTVEANSIKIDGQNSPWWTGIVSDAVKGSSGNAGVIKVNAGTLEILNILNGGGISSASFNGDGGLISLPFNSDGNAGDVIINASQSVYLSHGKINTSTSGTGLGGTIQVYSPSLTLDNSTEITATSSTASYSGNIKIDAGILNLFNSSKITVANTSTGNSGNINIATGQLAINDGSVISAATAGGKTGNIDITASDRLSLTNQGKITTQNTGTITNLANTGNHGTITLSAPDIDLKNSAITTESTGNVDAGDININFSHWLTMDPSFIMTTANLGNGGDITINGGQLIYLKDSGFLTSVSGATSNGGNIFVNAGFLIMDTAAIQANAIGGFGGDVNLHLNGLIASYDNLILAGEWVNWQPFVPGFNVIQAASETGVSGNINITSPQFNISNITKVLDAGSLVLPNVNRNPCQNSAGNSLKRAGKGGLPINEEKDDYVPAASVSRTPNSASPSKPSAETSPATTGQLCAGSAI